MNGYSEGQMMIIGTEWDQLRGDAEREQLLAAEDSETRQLSVGLRSLGAAAAQDTTSPLKSGSDRPSVGAACSGGSSHCGESAAAA